MRELQQCNKEVATRELQQRELQQQRSSFVHILKKFISTKKFYYKLD
jgi:hypothetical protein